MLAFGFFVFNPKLSDLAILCKFGTLVLFPLGVTFSKFYNPNLHNIAISDRKGFNMKNPISYKGFWSGFSVLITKTRWQNTQMRGSTVVRNHTNEEISHCSDKAHKWGDPLWWETTQMRGSTVVTKHTKNPIIIMPQFKSLYNIPFMPSYSQPIHTCFAMIVSND